MIELKVQRGGVDGGTCVVDEGLRFRWTVLSSRPGATSDVLVSVQTDVLDHAYRFGQAWSTLLLADDRGCSVSLDTDIVSSRFVVTLRTTVYDWEESEVRSRLIGLADALRWLHRGGLG